MIHWSLTQTTKAHTIAELLRELDQFSTFEIGNIDLYMYTLGQSYGYHYFGWKMNLSQTLGTFPRITLLFIIKCESPVTLNYFVLGRLQECMTMTNETCDVSNETQRIIIWYRAFKSAKGQRVNKQRITCGLYVGLQTQVSTNTQAFCMMKFIRKSIKHTLTPTIQKRTYHLL